MVNRNYENGRHKEYRIVKSLKKKGYSICVRSAGSHSIVDIWALNPITKTIKLIQSKLGGVSRPERERLMKEGNLMNGLYSVEFELIE